MCALDYFSTYRFDEGTLGTAAADQAMRSLKSMFPTGDEPDQDNVVLFSTSGPHGSYATIEDVETALNRDAADREPDDDLLTLIVLKPRQVITQAGNIRPTADDIAWLKRLRAASWAALARIGAPSA